MGIQHIGFANRKYLSAQTDAIVKRASFFNKMYLEVGGKLSYDYHAARILPGYDPNVKVEVLRNLAKHKDFEIFYCLSAKHLEGGKVRADFNMNYANISIKNINDLRDFGFDVSAVIINRFSGERSAEKFKRYLTNTGMRVYLQPEIEGYPVNIERIVSSEGYGKTAYIETNKDLVVVTGAGPGSGKMATCLSQMYHENKKGIRVGFSKYETFPVWNLPLEHAVNLAYEAATADIADKNMVDPFYLQRTQKVAINYNRDIENYEIISSILKKIVGDLNEHEKEAYGSPTDIAISLTKEGIINDEICQEAAKQEIIRRYFNYKKDAILGKEPKETLDRMDVLLNKLNLTPEYRSTVLPARAAMASCKNTPGKGHKDVYCGSAIQLHDGKIIAGKNSPLLHAGSAAVINSIKYLARIPDEKKLLPAETISQITELNKSILNSNSESLNVNEVLIALATSARTNEGTKIAMTKLKELRDCNMHTTHLLSPGDDDGLRKLGISVTTDAMFTTLQYIL